MAQSTPLPVDHLTAPIDPAAAKMVFQFEYSNFAWKYVHSGWFINENGDVYTYSYDRPAIGTSADGTKPGFKSPPTLFKQIDPDVLKQMTLKIAECTKGEITEKSVGADIGSGVYSAFLKDGSGKLTEIKIREDGDWQRINTAPAAVLLYEKLSAINEDITKSRLPAVDNTNTNATKLEIGTPNNSENRTIELNTNVNR